MEMKHLLFCIRVGEQDIPEQYSFALGLVVFSQMHFEVKPWKLNVYPPEVLRVLCNTWSLVFYDLYKKRQI